MTAERWTSVRVRHASNRPAVIDALFQSGAEGVQELDDEIVTHIRNLDERKLASRMSSADESAVLECSPTPDVDWSAEWRARVGPHRIGRIVVTPPWLADRFAPDGRVVIEPEMAFGTGEHETTRGVIHLMQPLILPGDTVADLGAGSAVLSIAAAKLGASRVAAIEMDPDAIGNAESNVDRNGVAGVVTVVQGDAALLLPLVAPVRVILANIISSVLVELLPTMALALAPDGVAILSGILGDEREEMERHLAAAGWRVVATCEEGEWWSVAISR